MTQTTDTLKDDIAYMAGLARDGHKPTYAGGEFLLMAGGVFGLTSLAVSASIAGLIPVSMDLIWLIGMAGFFICLPVLILRIRRSPSYRMLGNRAVGQAWTAIGWAIFVIGLACGIIGWQLNTAVHLNLMAPVILALYGVGWSVSASLSDRTLSKVLAVGSYLGALGVASLVKSPALMFLGYGAALLLLAALPGVIWIRLHRQAQG